MHKDITNYRLLEALTVKEYKVKKMKITLNENMQRVNMKTVRSKSICLDLFWCWGKKKVTSMGLNLGKLNAILQYQYVPQGVIVKVIVNDRRVCNFIYLCYKVNGKIHSLRKGEIFQVIFSGLTEKKYM